MFGRWSAVFGALFLPFLLAAQGASTPETGRPGESGIERLIDEGRLKEARRELLAVISKDGENARTLLLDAMILYKERKFADSIRLLERSIGLDTGKADAYKLMALNLVELKRMPSAWPFLKKAVELAPGDAVAWYYLGLFQLTTNTFAGFTDAETNLREALALQPSYLDARLLLGVTLEQLKRPEEAEAEYRKSIELSRPESGERGKSLLYLGRLLYHREDYEGCIAPLEKAAKLNPVPVEELKYLGRALRHLQRDREALKILEKVVKLAPRDSGIRYLLLQTYQGLGMTDEADRQMQILRELRKDLERP